MTPTTVTLPVVTALLDEAARKRYAGGVLGVRATPEWSGPEEFVHNGITVRVVRCRSTLAVREALLERRADRWLVVLTDRDESELGLGITAHLAWQRLRSPDPWAAVQERFGATRVDHGLVTAPAAAAIATGLLAAAPPEGWPPARVGLLTADHAFGAVAARRLALGTVGEPVDVSTVLRWSIRADAATAVADLRAMAGDALTDALLAWIAGRCGSCAGAVQPLLTEGRVADTVPMGLVARVVLATPVGSGPRALLGREVGGQLSEQVLAVWAEQAELVARDAVAGEPEAAARLLARAETLLERLESVAFAGESAVLRSGLTARLAVLGEALRRCADRAAARVAAAGPDGALVDPAGLPAVELACGQAQAHALAGHADEVRVPRAVAGVRLARWLSRPADTAVDVAGAAARHRDEDAWADRAIAEAWTGVGDEALARGLRALLGAARLRRDAHDEAFGMALAAHLRQPAALEPTGLIHLEELLPALVLPLARRRPVLLVVADGMSLANLTEVVDDVVRRYDSWLECLPAKTERRLAALAPLPSLTAVCRTSLFSGVLNTGDQAAERSGLAALAAADGLRARLFHKVSLDASPAGYALAPDVAAAIDDTAGTALVACVLNTIDDALDRSDPGGTAWTADTIRHLRPLLERARAAGRSVVLTADHGHVIERRQGTARPVAGASSNRSRPYDPATPPGEGEIRVRGPRVQMHDGDAVLAVSERLRYGPLKAGYHGGASPAEVVVPVAVLAQGEAPEGWRLAPPQSPPWWRGPLAGAASASAPAGAPRPAAARATARGEVLGFMTHPARSNTQPTPLLDRPFTPTLFDESFLPDLASAVLASGTYRAQRDRAVRAAITDYQVGRLLSALLDTPGNRLDAESAAAALGVATVQLTGALSQAQRLLNVEQYPVLSRDADGATVLLDATLLREQFGVGA